MLAKDIRQIFAAYKAGTGPSALPIDKLPSASPPMRQMLRAYIAHKK